MQSSNVRSWLGKTVVFGKIEGQVVQQEDTYLTVVTKSGVKHIIPNDSSKVVDISVIQAFSNSIVDTSVNKANYRDYGGSPDGKLAQIIMDYINEHPNISTDELRRWGISNGIPASVMGKWGNPNDKHPNMPSKPTQDDYVNVIGKGSMTNDETEDNKFENDSETHYPKEKDQAPNYKKVDDKRSKEKSYVQMVKEYSEQKGSDTSSLYNNDTQYHAEAVEKNPIGDAMREVATDMGNRALGGNVLRPMSEGQRNQLRTKPSDEVKPKKPEGETSMASKGIDAGRTAYLGKQGTPIGFTNTIGKEYVVAKASDRTCPYCGQSGMKDITTFGDQKKGVSRYQCPGCGKTEKV